MRISMGSPTLIALRDVTRACEAPVKRPLEKSQILAGYVRHNTAVAIPKESLVEQIPSITTIKDCLARL